MGGAHAAAGAGRATAPLVRRKGKLVETTWDEAIFSMVSRFQAIQQKHGPESVAWLGTGQMATEELAFLGALGKFGMGMRHGDGNTRQCMATAAVAYKQSFGFDAPPFTYDDFEQSDVLILVDRTCASRTPSCGSASVAIPIARQSWSSTRDGPRRQWPPRTTMPYAPRRPRAALRGRSGPHRARVGRSRVHRSAHRRLR